MKIRKGLIFLSDILISGYYGFKNSGDDALLLAIVRDLKKYKSDVKVEVLSKTPKETAEIYGVKAINRMNPFAVFGAIVRCRLLLSGGGTLIQDGTSTKSLLYYLTIIKTAHFFGKKVMLYSNGIGPLRDEHKKITKKVLNKADVITLRDEASLRELKALGVDKPETVLTADPAFDIACGTNADELLNGLGIMKGEKYVCVSIRNRKNKEDGFCAETAKTMDYLVQKYGYKILFLPMQPEKDGKITKKIQKMMKEESVCLERKNGISDITAVISKAEFCIGMRLHSLIYAVGAGVPAIGLVYDAKVAGFMDYINQRYYLDADGLTAEKLIAMSNDCIENLDKIKKEIEDNLVWLREKAESNAKYATELLDRKGRKRG